MSEQTIPLAELGTQFKDARMHRNVDVENVAKTLRISSKVIRAIEEGRREDLPQLVFLWGFIKSYGLYLGFSMKDLQKTYNFLSTTEEKPEFKPMSQSNISYMSATDKIVQRSKSKKHIYFLVIFLVLLALVSFIYVRANTDIFEDFSPFSFFASSNVQEENLKQDLNTSLVSEDTSHALDELSASVLKSLSTDTSLTVKEGELVSDTEKKTAENFDTNNLVALDEEKVALVSKESAQTENIQADSVADTQAQARAKEIQTQKPNYRYGEGPQKLFIVTAADCWLGIDLDNAKTKRNVLLTKGQAISLSFTTKASIVAGNAGGLEVVYNDILQTKPGRSGAVVTLVYP